MVGKDVTIVTCLYRHSSYSRMGGRDYGWEHYLAPFCNLLQLNANIVLFTDETIGGKAEEFFELNEYRDYKILIHDLDSFKYSNIIYNLKEQEGIIDKNGLASRVDPVVNDRNHHICLSKISFLTQVLNNNYFNSTYTYWIDAGLFHHGLIPETLGGMERLTVPDITRLWPKNKKSISNPLFFKKLLEKTPKELTFLGLSSGPGRPENMLKFFKEDKLVHIIGGLFGGKHRALKLLCSRFEEVLHCLFEENILSLEEEILSGIFADNFFDQKYLEFTHWGHDLPDEANYLGVPPGSNSFYKLFL